jgi:hypothetical protein
LAWPGSSTSSPWRPMTGCTAWSPSTWPSTAVSPRRPVAARSPGPARSTAASRASSAWWLPTRAVCHWQRYRPRPTVATTGCRRRPGCRGDGHRCRGRSAARPAHHAPGRRL